MNTSTTLWMAALAAGMMLLSGCGTTPEQRIAALQAQAQRAEQVVGQLGAAIPQVEAAAEQLRAVLADPAIDAALRDKTLTVLAAAEVKLAQMRSAEQAAAATLATLLEAIATLQAGGTITVAEEVQLYGQIGQQVSTALPPPWGGLVLLASSLVTLIGGLIGGAAKQKLADKDQIDRKAATLEEVVGSVDALLRELDARPDEIGSAAAAKTILKTNQSTATRAAVMELKD